MAPRVSFLGLNDGKATAHHGDTENHGDRTERSPSFRFKWEVSSYNTRTNA
jgi:hypothetical protein